jgi:hypothetical protein
MNLANSWYSYTNFQEGWGKNNYENNAIWENCCFGSHVISNFSKGVPHALCVGSSSNLGVLSK